MWLNVNIRIIFYAALSNALFAAPLMLASPSARAADTIKVAASFALAPRIAGLAPVRKIAPQ